MITVYISIGNSDDKLSQREWSAYWQNAGAAVRRWATKVHGEWLSLPADPFQNACWCAEVDDETAELILRPELVGVAAQFRQDSIAWAVAKTEFIGPLNTSEAPND